MYAVTLYYLTTFYFVLSLKLAKCGLEPMISGGEHTTYDTYPHSVFLIIETRDIDLVCGGSIINQVVILTAAHCLEDYENKKNKKVIIKYGHETKNKMQTTYMKDFAIHENYEEERLVNDICLVSAKKKIPLGVVKRVILMKHPPQTEYAYVAGWGYDENENLQNTLKHTSAMLQKLEVCHGMGWLPAGVFCAGRVTGIGAAAEGDSGSALIVNECIQIGLVSYRMESRTLIGYTNVSYFLDWIGKNAKRLYCSN